MANDTKTPQDIKDYICDYIIRSEKRIVRNEPTAPMPNLENLNETRLEWIEYYKPEVYYSRPENRPPNTNCPHWRQYALKENNNPSTPTNPSAGNNTSSSSYSVLVHSTNENTNSTTTEPKQTPNQIDLNPPESNSPNEVNQFDNSSADNSPEIPPNSKEKSVPTKSFSSNSPKPKLNGGFIVSIIIVAVFSAISLGYLIWKKIKR